MTDTLQAILKHAGRTGKVTGVCDDSRDIQAGEIFIARIQQQQYVRDALENGASLVIVEAPASTDIHECAGDSLYQVKSLDEAVQLLADHFYIDRLKQLDLVGITGTNGKTSTAWFTCGLLTAMGHRTGYVGTLGHGVYGESIKASRNTTPEWLTLVRYLSELQDRGCNTVVMEVSSHGIELGRIRRLSFSTAVFTNLQRDHLDFHGDMASYEAVKFSFFKDDPKPVSIINQADQAGQRLSHQLSDKVIPYISYGAENAADDNLDVYGEIIEERPEGYTLRIHSAKDSAVASFNVHGKYQIENLTAAIAICISQGFGLAEIAEQVAGLKSVPGRLQAMRLRNGVMAYVDYAHTPHGVENVLSAAEAGNIWCVLGCGGDRDAGKRSEMMRLASQYADHVVLTDDNVRGDSAEQIMLDMLSGVQDMRSLVVCRDRGKAIDYAIQHAESDAAVYILGKGDESSINYAGQMLMHSDMEYLHQLGART